MRLPGPRFRPGRRQELAAAFHDGGERYERIRPGYPPDLVDWLVADAAGRVVDLGAGTGKFTEHLVRRGLQVHAVDPSADMLAQLRWRLPEVRCHTCGAETLPFANASVNAMFAAQAWHWFDVTATSAEVCRVLDTGGTLGLIWNQLDVRQSWVHRLSRIIHAGDVHREGFRPPVGPGLELLESRSLAWQQQITTVGLAELAQSRSYYLRAPDPMRAKMLTNLDWYLHEHLGFTPGQTLKLPYITTAWRAVAR